MSRRLTYWLNRRLYSASTVFVNLMAQAVEFVQWQLSFQQPHICEQNRECPATIPTIVGKTGAGSSLIMVTLGRLQHSLKPREAFSSSFPSVRATRNPLLLFRLVALLFLLRLAERRFSGLLLFQEPPRSTQAQEDDQDPKTGQITHL